MADTFEPFFHYPYVTDEMADELQSAMAAHRAAQDKLLVSRTGKSRRTAAERLLAAQKELSDTANAIYETIYVTPAIIHVAGEKKHELDEH